MDADGNVLQTFSADDEGGDGYISEIEILRGDLSRVLYDDTRAGVEYVFGDQIAELAQDADGVDVASRAAADGASTWWSGRTGCTRRCARWSRPRERFVRHLGHVLAFYSVPNEFGLDRWMIEYQVRVRALRSLVA